MSGPMILNASRVDRTEAERKLVTCLHKLLMDVDIEKLLVFLHGLHVQFTLSCDAKGKFHARVFQNWRDDQTGEVVSIVDWHSTGKSARGALCNAVADLLASNDEDYHAFVNNGWADL